MIQLLFIIIAFIMMHIMLRLLMHTGRKLICVAFAGTPEAKPVKQEVNLPEREKFTMNGSEIEENDLEPIYISGRSLEKWGINDGDVVYVKKIPKPSEINKFDFLEDKKFIILKIDNERTREEKGFVDIEVKDGLKARKFIKNIENKDLDDDLKNYFKRILQEDEDYKGLTKECQKEFYEKLLEKYKFAHTYYHTESSLLFSETYRHNGQVKGYSFHSPKNLYGYVKYKISR